MSPLKQNVSLISKCFGCCGVFLIVFIFSGDAGADSWNRRLILDAKSGNIEGVKEDVKNANDLDNRDQFDNTALTWAARRGYLRIVRILVEKGADINAANRFGVTPLMWGVMRNHKEIVKFLLRKNARPNLSNEEGTTPLMWAAKKDYKDIAEVLLSNGAQLDATNSDHQTALMIAENEGHQDMVRFFQHWNDIRTGKLLSPGSVAPFIARFSVDKPDYQLQNSSKKWALVVGIETYQLSNVSPAEYAVRDAQAVEKHLLALGFEKDHIIELLGNNATRASIRDSVHRLQRNISDSETGATVFVYFSGHGAPDVQSDTSYIVPWDGDPADLPETGIRLSEFYKNLDLIPASHVIIVLDACFSGSGKGAGSVFGVGKRPLVVKVKEESLPHPGKMVVLSAARGDEMAGPDSTKKHGLFTYYLLKGLNGNAEQKGHVSIGDLFNYVSSKVRNRSELANSTQIPALQPSDISSVDNILLR